MRADHRGVVPSELGVGLGNFLQPAAIGEASVKNGRIGFENDFEIVGAGTGILRSRNVAAGSDGNCRERGTGQHAVVQRSFPVGFVGFVFFSVLGLPVIANDVVRARVRVVAESGEDFVRRAAFVERLN